MSVDGQEPPQNVVDEDGAVDIAVKKRIIQSRERVDETELALYRDAPFEPEVNLSEVEKVHIYGTTVKQFLRRIEPLLRTDKIDGNESFYRQGDDPIGRVTLVPPDTAGYRFSAVMNEAYDERELRQIIGLPRGVEIPQPHTVTFSGLQDVIERDTGLSYQWSVCISRDGAPPNWEYAYPVTQQAVPKSIYEEAMRKADMFLQHINLGLDLELPAYTGDDGPGI